MGYLLSALFFLTLSGRLSIIVDLLLDISVPDRVLTKMLWILGYVIVLAVVVLTCRNSIKTYIMVWSDKLAGLKYLNISILVFLLMLFLSALFSYDVGTALVTSGYYLLLISLMYIGYLLLDSKVVIDQFKRGLLISTLILVLVGALQYLDYSINQEKGWFISLFNYGGFVPASFFNIRTEDSGIFLRPSSLMVDTNIFSAFLSIVSIISLDFLVKNRYKILSLITVLASLAMIVLTASRTGFLMLAIGIIFYLLTIRMEYIKRLYYTLKDFIKSLSKKRLGMFSILPLSFSRLSLSDLSANEHINYWIQSIKIFIKFPILGIGSGNFPKYYRENIDSSVGFATAHSVYAKLLAEGGILGVFSFLLVIVSYMYYLVVRRLRLPIIVMVMMLAGNVTYDFFLTPWVWLLMGAFLSETEW